MIFLSKCFRIRKRLICNETKIGIPSHLDVLISQEIRVFFVVIEGTSFIPEKRTKCHVWLFIQVAQHFSFRYWCVVKLRRITEESEIKSMEFRNYFFR